MKSKPCQQCNKLFTPREEKTKYCSRECKHISITKFATCPTCNKTFKANRRTYCSKKCSAEARKIHFEKPCKICGNIFYSKSYSAKYCSRKCKGKSHSEFMKSPEMVAKIRKARKENPAWNKGKKTGIVPRTAFKKGIKQNIGENHHSWKGGRSKKNGYIMLYLPPSKNGEKGRYIFEHRYIMEQKIGRDLAYNEIVHHKNGIKDDNRIDNLELVLRSTHKGEVQCPHCLKHFSIK